MTDKLSVLIIDDDDSLRRVMELTLKGAGFKVTTAGGGESGVQQFAELKPELVITDVQMPDLSGYEVLRRIKQQSPGTIVIVITAFGTIEKAVRAMREGAYDYITKPFGKDDLVDIVKRAIRYQNNAEDLQQFNLDASETPTTIAREIIGTSKAIQQVRQLVKRVAGSDTTVLIQGGSGVGKEVVAKQIHQLSPWAEKPFVVVNCAAIPGELLESELFGHVKGAFTGAVNNRLGKFEEADGGTLFLDEIGELPLAMQAKLLRALQEKEIEPVGGSKKQISVRVLAATNRNLEQEVNNKQFREDLFYRLAVITIDIPALKERRDDIPLFIEQLLIRKNCSQVQLSEEAMALLKSYDWPGNVRELENCIERMLILRTSDRLETVDLPPKISRHQTTIQMVPESEQHNLSLPEIEKQTIIQALERNKGNQSQTAKDLQIPRHVLLYRMEKYAINGKKKS